MKKNNALCWLALPFLLLSCTKGYIDEDVSYTGTGIGNGGGRTYMLLITNDLVVDNLKTLENALYADQLGISPDKSVSYDTGGKSLREKGAVWTLKYMSGFEGLRMTALGEDSWLLEWDGDFDLGNNTYPTRYALTATCRDDMTQLSHFDWEVALDGTRTERDGYACHFWTENPLWYEVQGKSDEYWSSCTGLLVMEVTKNGKSIDGSTLQMKGYPSDAIYRRGTL